MKITETDIQNFALSEEFQNGYKLYKEGKVKLVKSSKHHFDAIVTDNNDTDYEIRIRKTPSGLFALCTCPSWSNCQHSVAALLAGKEFYESHKQTRPHWQAFFDSILPKQNVPLYEQLDQNQWKIIYLLNLQEDQWSLSIKKVYLKKSGEMGRVTNIGQFDSQESGVEYTPNDVMIISYLIRLKYRDHTDQGFKESQYIDNRPFVFDYGAFAGHIFNYMNSPLFVEKDTDIIDDEIHISNTNCQIEFEYLDKEESYELVPFVFINGIKQKIDTQFKILTQDPIWIFYKKQLFKVENIKFANIIEPFTTEQISLEIPKKEIMDFVIQTLPKINPGTPVPVPDLISLHKRDKIHQKKLYLSQENQHLNIKLVFSYDKYDVEYSNPHPKLFEKGETEHDLIEIDRDLEKEQEYTDQVASTGLKFIEEGYFTLRQSQSKNWLYKNVPLLVANDFEFVGLDQIKDFKVRTSMPNVRLEVTTDIDWFDLQFDIDIEGIGLSLRQLKHALKSHKNHIKLKDGSLALLPANWTRKFTHLLNTAEINDKSVKLAPHHLTLIDLLFEETTSFHADQAYQERIDRLKNFNGIIPQRLPRSLQNTLRPYQKAGYDWLHFLNQYSFGGCLADDMGLGKTLQALSLLMSEKEKGNSKPNLIICPTSVVFNWQQEVKKFTAGLTVYSHLGLERVRDVQEFNKYDIILTTYGIMRRDILFLKDFHFNYIILDESQKIKNPNSQTAKASRLLTGRHRLSLTGTPIENNTLELWSQFSFVNPGLLGNIHYFKRTFVTSIEKEQDDTTLNILRRLVYPFILRRTKEKVAMDLPPKTEQTVFCSMNSKQKNLYEQWRNYYRALLLDKISEQGIQKTRMNVLEGLIKLRQIACHPNLIEKKITEDSGKFQHFKEIVEEILSENHKVLIFSQFVRMLKIIKNYFDKNGIRYEYLDGHTINREKVVENFQKNKNIKIFLISLKAGGTGLNLTAADYVILYDPWWNPAVEIQAMDRAHRIGQNKNVFVYKLISKDTVEEKMLELQQRKKSLVDNLIVTDQRFFKSLTKEDIDILFS